MTDFFIYLAVIMCGAAVLAIELVGTRIIAPYFGASIYQWSALISITLAALSSGYLIGGRLADRGTKLTHFSTIIALSGLWIVLIPWLQGPILTASTSMGLRTAVLVSSTVLFFPPLALLGMVSPYAIRMKASSLEVVGRTAGNLYAVSTLASVVAAVTTGFFLIPNVGVTRLIFLIGLVLIATALFGLILNSRKKGATVLSVALLAVVTQGYSMAPVQTADPQAGLLAIDNSPYAEIRVVDFGGLRHMLIDGGTHTIVDPSTWESHFPYVNVLDIADNFFDRAGDLLLVGLGGGSVVKNFGRKGWQIDAVEIDPVVTAMALQYFGLRDDEGQVYEMDGRQFLINSKSNYDLIIIDAYGSSSIPFHLVTKEAFSLIGAHLASEGILAMNIETVGWDDIIARSLAATASQEFEYVLLLPIAEPPDQLGNVVMLASDLRLELKRTLPLGSDRFSPEYDRNHAWDNRFSVDTTGVPILTDDLNPIDVWTEHVNLAARRRLHDYFGEAGLAW